MWERFNISANQLISCRSLSLNFWESNCCVEQVAGSRIVDAPVIWLWSDQEFDAERNFQVAGLDWQSLKLAAVIYVGLGSNESMEQRDTSWKETHGTFSKWEGEQTESVTHWQSQSAVSQSPLTSESVTLRHPPLGVRGDCTAGCFHFHMYEYIYIYTCMLFFKHATCMSLSGTGSSDDCSMTILAYNSTYGLGNFQAWFRFYLGLV